MNITFCLSYQWGPFIVGAITFVTATGFCWRIKSILILGYCVLCLYGLYKVNVLHAIISYAHDGNADCVYDYL